MNTPANVTISRIHAACAAAVQAAETPISEAHAEQMVDVLWVQVWRSIAPAEAVAYTSARLALDDPSPEAAPWLDTGEPETASARALTGAIQGVLRKMLDDALMARLYDPARS